MNNDFSDDIDFLPTEEVYIYCGAWRTWKSRIIRWVTRSSCSHVWIQYNSERWGGPMVVHADTKGVIIEAPANFYSRRERPSSVSIYKVVKGDPSSGFIHSSKYLGKDYGYIAVILNLFLLLLWNLGFRNLRGMRDVGKYVCSEFVTLFIKHSYIPCDLDPELTWPGKLEDWINNHPKYFERVL